jgi:hypothetical protein
MLGSELIDWQELHIPWPAPIRTYTGRLNPQKKSIGAGLLFAAAVTATTSQLRLTQWPPRSSGSDPKNVTEYRAGSRRAAYSARNRVAGGLCIHSLSIPATPLEFSFS